MTEQERMKQGYVWQDDDENMSLQAHTKALVREFNSMPPEDMEGREKTFPIILQLLQFLFYSGLTLVS